jgi:hypothetical protein
MGIMLALAGSILAIVGYVWLFVLVVRELDATALVIVLLFIGCFTLISVVFVWYFSIKRWDIAKRPLIIHALGLLMMLVGFLCTPTT